MTRATHWPRLGIALMMLSLGALACNLFGGQSAPPTAIVTATSAAGAPTVVINSPTNGVEAVRGQEVLVQSTATDTIGVTRVELRVNGFIVNTVASQEESGDTEFAVIQTWTPAESGEANLEVIAYRGPIASEPARLTVQVRESAAQVTATLPVPVGVTPTQFVDNVCRARVDVEGLNFRTGPGTNYDILSVLTLGNSVQINGRLGDNSWWRVQSGPNIGWISSTYTTETGDCSAIPVVAAPPSPTPRPATPTPTATPTHTSVPDVPTSTPTPTVTLTPTPSIPDLVVSAISGPTLLELNATGTVGARYTVTVRNQGTANSGQFNTSFQHPDGTVAQLPIVADLAPGQSANLEVDVLFAASNTYRLAATADSGSSVAESDEGNNVRTLDVVVTAPPQ